jgi:hypothetical protein
MTQHGFWRQTQPTSQRLTLNPLGGLNNVWYVAPQGVAPSLGFPVRNTFETFADLSANLRSRDIVYVVGVVREHFSAPVGIYDVTIMGAANTPRQATSSGTPTGGGATWLAPTSPTALTPLLELREQGWAVENIMFGTVASTPAIRLKRQETAANPDASHARISGCYFATQGLSTEHGIGSESLFHSIIEDCLFLGLSGTALLGESVSIATPSSNQILRNYFRECANAIDWPMNYGVIDGNRLKDITTKQIDINVGADNYVGINFFDKSQANISIAGGFIGNASDIWRNYSSDTVGLTVGVPA